VGAEGDRATPWVDAKPVGNSVVIGRVPGLACPRRLPPAQIGDAGVTAAAIDTSPAVARPCARAPPCVGPGPALAVHDVAASAPPRSLTGCECWAAAHHDGAPHPDSCGVGRLPCGGRRQRRRKPARSSVSCRFGHRAARAPAAPSPVSTSNGGTERRNAFPVSAHAIR
jgi:hypothetical protein